jgi:hypothetical protein
MRRVQDEIETRLRADKARQLQELLAAAKLVAQTA